MALEHDSNRSGKMHEKVIPCVQRRRYLKRKETARRKLIDSIYTRQGDAMFSVPCLSGERMNPGIKFPRLRSKEMSILGAGYSDFRSNCESKHSQNRSAISQNSYTEIVDESGRTGSVSQNSTYGYSRKSSSSQNLSLPEIIMEFNSETSMAINHNGVLMKSPSTEFNDDERVLGAPYEEFLNKTKYNKYNPCQSHYRPVTPGLLKSLNERKVPLNVKTEQWVRSSQSSQKPFHGPVYKTDNIKNRTHWIYDEKSKVKINMDAD